MSMKKLTLFLLWMFCSTALFSQVYKLETVFSDRGRTDYLSYWKPLEGGAHQEKKDTFSLWGYHLYHDNWATGAYEVEYFKGSAAEMYHLLQEVAAFSEKYGNEDKVITEIKGLRVKTVNQLGFKYTLVFDKERKVACQFTQKQWKNILDLFASYCKTNQIGYSSS
ncbi:hypothetical protein LQ567_23210 [Niabella pedocola]|uniref:DUF3805 domain-containing protein n=1 Tax=Niabella pedocola TaxID=1752077 RepID=A0ABS8PXC0_9BACT|nr:hypothetical protein [Niabella pedocola]MCD2425712.1 hypothetical protein [Niabella pedocola]